VRAPTRRWARTDNTQQRILDAATDVFAARGFSAATMADIVDHSSASIGSIYHHFGGKKELFLAIYDQLAADVEQRIEATIEQCGELDRQRTFEASVRAYLDAMWANRRAATVLANGDAPAGFDRITRRQMLTTFGGWMSVLDLDTTARGRLLTRVLAAVMAEATAMVLACDDPAGVRPITDATVECVGRLTS
jgi:AcrR family transcriptional regulator